MSVPARQNLIANASITINAPIAMVWGALTTPDVIQQYMFGTTVTTTWQIGSAITRRGEWQGKSYEDKGRILKLEKKQFLQYSHFSPLSGKPDVPDNYHTVTIELEQYGDRALVTLSQDNNATDAAREHSRKNWQMMLDGLKKLLEK